MAYPVILTGSGTALCAAPFQMLLTCDSSLLVRQTRVCRRRLYVPRLKPRVICVTFHGGCGHFLKTTRKEKGSWICLGKLFEFWGAASPMFWDPHIVYDFLQTSSSLTFSLPRPELRTMVLGPPPGLPGLAPQPPTSGCQTGSVFFQQTEQKPFWFTPRSSRVPPGFPSHVSVSVDGNSMACLLTDSRFIFWRKWSSLVEFSTKESFRMAFVRPPAGTENVLTGILFLRNKR